MPMNSCGSEPSNLRRFSQTAEYRAGVMLQMTIEIINRSKMRPPKSISNSQATIRARKWYNAFAAFGCAMLDTLKGQLLVASPKLRDPNFFRAVILLVQHDEKGSLGLVLNRPM